MTKKGIEWIRAHYGDGWSIFDPKGIPWDDLGLTKCRESMIKTHVSGNTPKSQISTKEGFVASLDGVHLLAVFRMIAEDTGADTKIARQMLGRGSEARALCDAIIKVAEKEG